MKLAVHNLGSTMDGQLQPQRKRPAHSFREGHTHFLFQCHGVVMSLSVPALSLMCRVPILPSSPWLHVQLSFPMWWKLKGQCLATKKGYGEQRKLKTTAIKRMWFCVFFLWNIHTSSSHYRPRSFPAGESEDRSIINSLRTGRETAWQN